MEEEKGIIRYCNIVIIPVKGEGGNKGDDTDDEGIEGELGLSVIIQLKSKNKVKLIKTKGKDKNKKKTIKDKKIIKK